MGKYELRGKHVLITGASSGIGREIARCAAAEGAHCALHAPSSEREALRSLARELEEAHGVRTWCFFGDFAKPSATRRLHEEAMARLPRIDVLVNNAGVMAYGNFHELPIGRMEDVVRVNAMAYLSLMRLVIPGMVSRRDGRILNVSSTSAFQPCPHHAVYGAAKSLVQNLSEAVNRELRGTGVRITAFCPSYTDTPLLKGEGFPERVRWYRVSGLPSPATVARHGIRALVTGKAVYIPGVRNRLIHTVLNRMLPRRAIDWISDFVLRPE